VRRHLDERLVSIGSDSSGSSRLAVTERHRYSLRSAMNAVDEARRQMACGADEIAASLLRSAVEQLGFGQAAPIDEQLLDRIFSRFCIGK
jgi:tRNA U34 5-carboxymethylaminomethyl modifying GTPase MnmE/TrmE